MCDECSTGCKNLTFIINKFESLGGEFHNYVFHR